MKKFYLSLFVLALVLSTSHLFAAETSTDTATVAPTTDASSDNQAVATNDALPADEAPIDDASAVDTAAPVDAVQADAVTPDGDQVAAEGNDENIGEMENVSFVTGEVVSFDKASSMLKAKIYLNEEGDAVDQTLDVKVVTSTIITDGDNDFTVDQLTEKREIDIEYSTDTKEATYIFVY